MNSLTENEVRDALAAFAAAYSAKDADAVMALISPEPDTVMVGTGADEVRFGLDAIRAQIIRDTTQAEQLSLDLGQPQVTLYGDVAWVFAEPTAEAVVDGQTLRMPMRLTLVLVKTSERVLIRNSHLSVAFATQEPGQSFAHV